mmetsp:Transcript_42795/g.103277  ORF Transcript_42795/g.103277 Transcript_42795/m.103277 type:complete len:779 (+) Transcript_42795:668-3004(+)
MVEIAAFTHISVVDDDNTIKIIAMEYSRNHREDLLRQEFGSWLLEEYIEKAVIATTLEGNVVFWNRFASELYQYEKEYVTGKSIMDLTPSEMTMEQGQEIMAKLRQGEHWNGYFRVRRKDNSSFMAHVTDTPILDTNGQVKFIVGVSADYTEVHDLTDRLQKLNEDLEEEVRRRTEKLVEQETQLRNVGAAINESDTGVLITDASFSIVWSNHAVSELLSVPGDSLHGVKLTKIPQLQDSKEWKKICEEGSKKSLAHWSTEIDVSSYLPVEWLRVTIQPMMQVGSQATTHEASEQRMISINNISAEKRAEIAQSNAEKESAMNEAKTQMMQMLSHELRSPLQGIMGVTSTMLADMDVDQKESELYDEISTILACSRLLLTLINTVLDVRKIDENMMQTFKLDPVSVIDSVEGCIHFCRPFAAQQNVSLEVMFTEHKTERNLNVFASRLRLEQVLVNLITNSIKYTKQGTRVEIRLREANKATVMDELLEAASSDLKIRNPKKGKPAVEESPDYVVVSIRDHGKGIPANEYDKVFGEFMQLSTSDELDDDNDVLMESDRSVVAQPSGTGLGLNLVMKFVLGMKGHVWFNNSTDGPGLDFHFCLPKCADQQPSATDMVHRTSLTELLTEEGVGSNFHVMIVDDSIINIKVLSKMFKKLGNKSLTTANGGTAALEYLKRVMDDPFFDGFFPDLVVCDINMPDMSGFDVVSRIKRLEWESEPTVMAWSADFSPELEEKCISVGFDGVMSKPLTIFDLEAVLVSLVRERDRKLEDHVPKHGRV